MRKLVLSVLVIAGFVAYSYQQRHDKPAATDTSSLPASSDQLVRSPQSAPSPAPLVSVGQYKDGTYTGSVADAFYGNLQVRAVIRMGRLMTVTFLQYPNDRTTSREINGQAMPILRQEAVQAQSANVDIITGATDTSMAFIQSLTAALASART